MVAGIAEAYPAVTFVGVAARDEVPAMQEFVDTYPVQGFRHLADTDASIWARFGVTRQPAYAFVDADGSVEVIDGALSETDLTERVAALSSQ